MSGRLAIGVDLGGTNLRAAVLDETGSLIAREQVETQAQGGPEAILEDLVELLARLIACQPRDIAGIGVGVPGIIDMSAGTIRISPNLQTLNQYPVQAALEERLQRPVVLENDANAAALGEYWMGAGVGVGDLVLLTLGTGVGGGVLVDGRVLHGKSGMAGELGHLQVVPGGSPCGCGGNGCLEKYASATAVSAMAKQVGLGEMSASEVASLAESNELGQRIWDAVGASLGRGLGMLVNTFDAPLYLLSGGVVGAWDRFAPTMFAELERSSYVYRYSRPRVERAALGAEAGLFGAAYLGFRGTI